MSDRRQHFHDQLYCHFVTFSCHHRRQLLEPDQPKRILLGTLNEQLQRQSAKCIGFVIMPDHVHILLWFPKPGQLSRFLQTWKRLSSHGIRCWWNEHKLEYCLQYDLSDGIWTPKYYSFEIYDEPKLIEKLDYMHLNPVRAGIASKALEWKWSSARWYEEKRSVGVPIDWIF